MKRYRLIVFFLILCICQKAISQTDTISIASKKENIKLVEVSSNGLKKTITGLFKVYEITKTKDAYIIEAYSVEDSLGRTIVSLKSKNELDKKGVIKIGDTYQFYLNSYFSKDYMPGDLTFSIQIQGVDIRIKPKGINVYTTSNLVGLNYVSQ